MMTVEKVFRTSVNVNFDIGDENFISSYLPTPSHAESIIGLSRGFVQDDSNSAHIMIGPYGTGKSLLASILAGITGKVIRGSLVNELINKFERVHQDVFRSLETLEKLERIYLPVTITGKSGSFGDVLIEKIQEALIQNNIAVELPTMKKNVLDTIEKWKENYVSTYEKLKKYVLIDYNSFEDWYKQIEDGKKQAIDWFVDVYPTLTSGAKFHPNENGDFIGNLQEILKILKQKNIGLFIIYDEFGRFFQNLEQKYVYRTMQELQDIAELCNRSERYLQLLLISHKSMSQYMLGMNEEYQAEFQRIEKRYATYFIESDSATYYRIVHQYIQDRRLPFQISEEKNNSIILQLRGLDLFKELNHHEVEEIIVRGSKPIHPITLFLLPRISQVFGQNERTLFTYLESEESNGLKQQLKSKNGYIYADSLFTYFFNESNINDFSDEYAGNILRTYRRIKSNLDLRKKNAHRIVKFITLWQITNSNSIYKLDDALLEFATGMQSKTFQETLDELLALKFIRYNPIQDSWELSVGSSLVVEELIEKQKPKLNIDIEKRIDLLNSLSRKKYYLARDYNEEKSMTRFMKVKIVHSQIIINSNKLNKTDYDKLDGLINFIIIDKKKDYFDVIQKVKENKSPHEIFAILSNELNSIELTIDNYLVIKKLLNNNELLSNYQHLKEELLIYKESYSNKISTYLNNFFSFNNNVTWYHCGKEIYVRSDVELEEIVSNIMWDLYPDTPIITHDAINRFIVQGIQMKSIYEVMERLLVSPYDVDLGIEGHGPAYLTYATVLKNNGVNLRNLDETKSNFIAELRGKLLSYIKINNNGSLINIYNILNGSPYGIRPPLIPLILVLCLRDVWKQLMFYNNNMFVPAIKGEHIHEMVSAAKNYEYVYHDYSKEMAQFMDRLEAHFKPYISEYVLNESQLIKVSSGLLNWLRSLPKQTQITNRFLDEELLVLKEIIRKSEVNPIESISKLSEIYKNNYQYFIDKINQMKDSHLKFVRKLENTFLEKIGVSSFEKKELFISKWDEEKQLKNKLIKALKGSESADEFFFNYIGTEVESWSDINFDLFVNQLNSEIKELNSINDVTNTDYYIETDDKFIPIKSIKLSKKSEIIYNNLKGIVNRAGRNVPKDEINFILYSLIKEHNV